MKSNNGGLPGELRSLLIYAAAAVNAWLLGLSIPCVALHYRYEPLTALGLIRRLRHDYGLVHIERDLPARVLTAVVAEEESVEGAGPLRRCRSCAAPRC